MLHIQQSSRNIMMPISQLVVLVSYNFWVQLFHSDLPHQRGFKEKEEKRWKVRTVAEKQKIVQVEAQGYMKEKWHHRILKKRLSTCRCVLNCKPRQMFNIGLIFGIVCAEQNSTKRRTAGISFWRANFTHNTHLITHSYQ